MVRMGVSIGNFQNIKHCWSKTSPLYLAFHSFRIYTFVTFKQFQTLSSLITIQIIEMIFVFIIHIIRENSSELFLKLTIEIIIENLSAINLILPNLPQILLMNYQSISTLCISERGIRSYMVVNDRQKQ